MKVKTRVRFSVVFMIFAAGCEDEKVATTEDPAAEESSQQVPVSLQQVPSNDSGQSDVPEQTDDEDQLDDGEDEEVDPIDDDENDESEAELSLLANQGEHLGELTLQFVGIEDFATKDSIVVRRALGETAPPDCQSGTLIATIQDFSSSTYTDAGLYPETYSYRTCLLDEASTVLAESTASSQANATQRIFVTSETFHGEMGSLYRGRTFDFGRNAADYKCQVLADDQGLGGLWRAIVSSDQRSARFYVPVFERVVNMQGQEVAPTRDHFWDGNFTDPIGFDEMGNAANGAVWTGTSPTGLDKPRFDQDCGNFRSTSGTGAVGQASSTTSSWLDDLSPQSCATTAALYCLESLTPDVDLPDLTVTTRYDPVGYHIDVELTFGDLRHIDKVDLRYALSYDDDPNNEWMLVDVLDDYDCQGNTLQREFGGASLNPLADFSDTKLEVSATSAYIYYACAWDRFGNLLGTPDLDAVTGDSPLFLIAFVSTATFDGASLSQASANAACDSEAIDMGLLGAHAVVSDSAAVTAKTNVPVTLPELGDIHYYDSNSNYVGYISSTDFRFDGAITDRPEGTMFWTGTLVDGSAATNRCSDWTTNSSAAFGTAGTVSPYRGEWTQAETNVPCDIELPVICFADMPD